MTAFTSCYFDDIAIFSSSEEEHLFHIKHVFDPLIKCNLRINFEKCQWFKQEVNFLGHLVSKNGVKPLRSKIAEIVHFKPRDSVDELRKFLGLMVVGPLWKMYHCMVRLAQYQFILEKIDNNRISSKWRFWASKFWTSLEASCNKIRHSTPIKTTKYWRTTL